MSEIEGSSGKTEEQIAAEKLVHTVHLGLRDTDRLPSGESNRTNHWSPTKVDRFAERRGKLAIWGARNHKRTTEESVE